MITPTLFETLARARLELRLGLPVVLRDQDFAITIMAAANMQPERLAELPGPLTLTLTQWRAEGLRMAAYDGDMLRIALSPRIAAKELAAIADPALDLEWPLKGPFEAIRSDAEPERSLARLAIKLTKSARLLPAAVLAKGALPNALVLDANDLRVGLDAPLVMLPEVSARLPMRLAEAGRLTVFRSEGTDEEHVAITIGDPSRDEPVLARLHSACFTGDIMGSLKCDCGAQLAAALSAMNAEGSGVLLYLNQEGRGIGLANKMRAYHLQDQGFDTVDANHRLGFEDEERDFRIGATMLKALGFKSVRLLTNNPAKLERLNSEGMPVMERVPIIIEAGHENGAYLKTKARKSGHML